MHRQGGPGAAERALGLAGLIWLSNGSDRAEASWLDFEASQGSLLAYFYNSHGRHAPLAVGVLRRMGASRMADVVAQAAASYGRASAGWAARRAELAALGEFAVVKPYAGLPNADDLDQLTDQYWQAADDDDWGSRLDTYLHEQVALLRHQND